MRIHLFLCSEHIPLLHLYVVYTFIYALQRVHVLFLLLLRVLYLRTHPLCVCTYMSYVDLHVICIYLCACTIITTSMSKKNYKAVVVIHVLYILMYALHMHKHAIRLLPYIL
jgi:hypothetical protein